MRLFIHATDETYRQHIADELNQGRLSLARLTFGEISGHGWGFVGPWAQQALFPHKGTYAGVGGRARRHEQFALCRVWQTWTVAHHPNHRYPVHAYYAYGIAWRRSWGKWWNPACWRWVLLDHLGLSTWEVPAASNDADL